MRVCLRRIMILLAVLSVHGVLICSFRVTQRMYINVDEVICRWKKWEYLIWGSKGKLLCCSCKVAKMCNCAFLHISCMNKSSFPRNLNLQIDATCDYWWFHIWRDPHRFRCPYLWIYKPISFRIFYVLMFSLMFDWSFTAITSYRSPLLHQTSTFLFLQEKRTIKDFIADLLLLKR